jgi:hypothetical protein
MLKHAGFENIISTVVAEDTQHYCIIQAERIELA